MVGLVLLGFVGTALAIDQPELDNRIRLMTAKLEQMQARPDKSIPADLLDKAQGIILLDRTKAGFLFAFQGGSGVALVKDLHTKTWGSPAFIGASEISLGFQAGGEEGFYAILLMDTNSTRLLTGSIDKYGSEARGTAGYNSGGAEGTASLLVQQSLIFDDRRGLFGGADLAGGSIVPDDRANVIYYGRPLTMQGILFDHKAPMTDAGSDLIQKLMEYSKVPQASKTYPR
jgi:lipid-binding SYLF domain-containing protein